MLLRTHIMVDTGGRMYQLLWDGVGEDTAITTTVITADIAMGGIQGIRGGIGKPTVSPLMIPLAYCHINSF